MTVSTSTQWTTCGRAARLRHVNRSPGLHTWLRRTRLILEDSRLSTDVVFDFLTAVDGFRGTYAVFSGHGQLFYALLPAFAIDSRHGLPWSEATEAQVQG